MPIIRMYTAEEVDDFSDVSRSEGWDEGWDEGRKDLVRSYSWVLKDVFEINELFIDDLAEFLLSNPEMNRKKGIVAIKELLQRRIK